MQVSALYDLYKNSTGISTDTRSIKQGNIFFALKGENFNGNLFAEKALQAGASAVVIDESHFPPNEKLILVDDPDKSGQAVLKTLQQLANHHRRQLKTKVIAIAGSNGKTTTKELISRVLETSFKTFSTKGNLNNHIGVPLSLLSIKEEDEFAVIELGANHLGETRSLCEIAEPDFGLITNNGKDHLEGYGSIEGVRKGNSELYEFLSMKNAVAFVCGDQEDLMKMSAGMRRVTYGTDKSANCVGKIDESFPFLKISLEEVKIDLKNFDLAPYEWQLETQLIGQYNFENIMAAVHVGGYFGVELKKIKQAIESYSPSNNRSQILKLGTNTFILDAYNANPSSMNAALENFFSLPAENKIVILGDMAELGSASLKEHREVIERLRNETLRMKILVGKEFERVLSDTDKSFLHFKNVKQLKDWFSKQSFENYFFLLKASRVIGLEKLLN